VAQGTPSTQKVAAYDQQYVDDWQKANSGRYRRRCPGPTPRSIL
jgi:hypothetical protein